MSDTEEVKKVFWQEPWSLADGTAMVVDTRGLNKLTIITGTLATATYSRVDTSDASTHTTGTENGGTVAANTALVLTVDWPYVRVSTAGGATRVAVV